MADGGADNSRTSVSHPDPTAARTVETASATRRSLALRSPPGHRVSARILIRSAGFQFPACGALVGSSSGSCSATASVRKGDPFTRSPLAPSSSLVVGDRAVAAGTDGRHRH